MVKEAFLFFSFLLLLQIQTIHTKTEKTSLCSSSCGNIQNITYPFRIQTDPRNCGNYRYTLVCEKNTTILYLYSGKYYVQSINYNNYPIRLVDSGVKKDDCSSIPRFPLTIVNFSLEDPFAYHKFSDSQSRPPILTFIRCPFQVSSPLYVQTDSCSNYSDSKYLYVNVGGMDATDLKSKCRLELMTMLAYKDYKNMSFLEIHDELAYGFELSWHYIYCGRGCRGCFFDESNKVQCIGSDSYMRACYIVKFTVQCRDFFDKSVAYVRFYRIIASTPTVLVLLVFIYIVTRTICGTPFVIGFLIYKWQRRHLSGYTTVEHFLQNHNNLMPVRYSYSDIKKMTKGFKNQLGEGGFGCVYKGKLRSGRIAAIKILKKSQTNGQDFINEVATLGRIHHANVVQLIGFCVEGSKQALIYDFMPNGSLNNYVFSQERSLSWENLYEISIGIARGIEYLHRGCDMQILHFDIKPHNTLLDENFIPKISDFGLAKLYETDGSIKSLTAARGTIGYMAPELFYRNLGRVSYKADVYSFGMLLLEIAGKRKNLSGVEESSNYFPFWVYDEVFNDKYAGTNYAIEEENKVAKKMVVVGLWCIQMNPINRPPMNKVIEMLENDVESLELPPRSGMTAEEIAENYAEEAEEESSSSLPVDFSDCSSLIQNSF